MSWLLLAMVPPLAAACATDVRWRIIPDMASVALGSVGLAAAFAHGTLAGVLGVGLGCALAGLLAARIGLWGLGDAKLFAAAGLLVGADGILPMLLVTSASGAALASLLLAARPLALSALGHPPAALPRWIRNELRRLRVAPSVPYAIPIAAGVLTAVAVTGRLWP